MNRRKDRLSPQKQGKRHLIAVLGCIFFISLLALLLSWIGVVVFTSSFPQVTSVIQDVLEQQTNHPNLLSNTLHPYSQPRLLYMAASYTMDQFLYLQKSLDSVKDICNSGWNVTIHLQVSNNFESSHEMYDVIRNRLYCSYTKAFIPMIIESYEKIGFGLNSRHRLFMRNHLNEFDYFVYAEEDMILTPSILRNHIQATDKFRKHLPKTWMRYYIGLIRSDWTDFPACLSWV